MLRRRHARLSTLCLLASLAATVMAAPALAQSYESDPFDQRLRTRGQIAKRYAKEPTGSPADKKEFEEYYEKYYFPAMTQPTPEALEDLGKMQGDLMKVIQTSPAEVQKYLSGQAFRFAAKVLKSKRYHPSVTYNALLILGKIDSRYGVDGGDATPDARANSALNKLAVGAAKSGRVPRYWLVGSLAGLERHCRYFNNLPQAAQQATETTLVGILTAEKLAGDYDEGVRDWVYLQAARALANTGSPGQGGRRMLAVAKRIGDTTLEIETRAEMAALLAGFKAEAGSFDATPAIESVSALAAEIAKQERQSADEFERSQLRRGGAGLVTGVSRSKSARRYRQGDSRQVILVRNGLLDLLNDLSTGVNAVQPLAKDQAATSLGAIAEALGRTTRQIADEDEIDLNVASGVKQMARDIDSATAATDADAPDEEEPF